MAGKEGAVGREGDGKKGRIGKKKKALATSILQENNYTCDHTHANTHTNILGALMKLSR